MTINRRPSREPERIKFARDQRKHANEFADHVWQLVRSRRMLGEKFRREHSVVPYTLDFACCELMLDIEVDGKHHLSDQGQQRDADRDAYLKSLGFEVLRIKGFRTTQDLRGVREEIEAVVGRLRAKPLTPDPSPPEDRGRGE